MKIELKAILTQAAVVFLALGGAVLFANIVSADSGVWNPPTAQAPGGNTPAPLNVGSSWQIKQGGVELNAGGVQAQALIVRQGSVELIPIQNCTNLATDAQGNIICSPSTAGIVYQ